MLPAAGITGRKFSRPRAELTPSTMSLRGERKVRRVCSADPASRVLSGVLALLGFASVPVLAANPLSERGPSAPDVLITTDARAVAGCVSRGAVSLSGDDGLGLLRREAVGRGADVVRLTSLVGREVRGELYRCTSPSEPPPPVSPTATVGPREQAPTSAPGSTPRGPVALSPSPGSFPPTPTPAPPRAVPGSTEARRRAAADRQKRAQEELDDLKAAVRLTEDPKLVEGCEKRGEARESRESGEDALRADAVGDLANAVLLRRTDSDLAGEFFRCSSRQLQSIPREGADSKR
jgi:hypothetical protein